MAGNRKRWNTTKKAVVFSALATHQREVFQLVPPSCSHQRGGQMAAAMHGPSRCRRAHENFGLQPRPVAAHTERNKAHLRQMRRVEVRSHARPEPAIKTKKSRTSQRQQKKKTKKTKSARKTKSVHRRGHQEPQTECTQIKEPLSRANRAAGQCPVARPHRKKTTTYSTLVGPTATIPHPHPQKQIPLPPVGWPKPPSRSLCTAAATRSVPYTRTPPMQSPSFCSFPPKALRSPPPPATVPHTCGGGGSRLDDTPCGVRAYSGGGRRPPACPPPPPYPPWLGWMA